MHKKKYPPQINVIIPKMTKVGLKVIMYMTDTIGTVMPQMIKPGSNNL